MSSASELWQYRSLIGNLAGQELRARYKRSVLGWLWSLLNPLSTLIIYTVVFGLFLRVEPPVAGNGQLRSFPLFLFAGLVVWGFFNGVVNGAIGSLTSAGPLLKKVYFPPEAPPIANILSVSLQSGIELALLLAILIVLGNVSWTFLLVLGVFALLCMFAIGLGLILSLLNVYYRDVGYFVGILMNLLFYATPIIYPPELIPEQAWGLPVRLLMSFNPLYHYVGAVRDLLYHLQAPGPGRLAAMVVSALVMFTVGRAIFSRFARNISEEL